MAVALATLVPTLRRAVNPPGQDFYPGAGQNEWRGRLADAFWEARLNDFFPGYAVTVDGQSIVPIVDGADDLGREQQQLVVKFAAVTAIRNRIMGMTTSTHRKAGPVETTTERSPAVLAQLLKDLTAEFKELTATLKSSTSSGRAAAFFDTLIIANERVLRDGGWLN